MVKVNVDFKPVGDLRRRYNNHRKHHLAGTKTPYSRTHDFFMFETLDDLLADINRNITKAVQEVHDENAIGGVKTVDITVKRASQLGFNVYAIYTPEKSTSTKATFIFNVDLVLNYVYRLMHLKYGDNLNSERFHEKYKKLKPTLNHEYRHHLDRNIITIMYRLLVKSSEIFAKENIKKQSHGNGDILIQDHLLRSRAEGYAMFTGKVLPSYYEMLSWSIIRNSMAYNEDIGVSEILKRSPSPEVFLAQELVDQTTTVQNVYEFLEDKVIDRSDWIDIKNASGTIFDEQPFEMKTPFSPYNQGQYFFQIIALNELKKQLEASGEYEGLGSLLKNTSFPADIHQSVSQKAIEQPSFTEFYKWFYDSAQELGLTDKQIIIPKRYVEKYVKTVETGL